MPEIRGDRPSAKRHAQNPMGSIREVQSDIQIIEIKREDLTGKLSWQDVAQGVLNIVKAKHHHADGTPVDLRIVQQTHGANIADAAFREHIEVPKAKPHEPEQQRPPSGIEAVAAEASRWSPQPQSSAAVGSSTYERGALGGGTDGYKAGSGVSGFNIQCGCGMEFTGAGGNHGDMMVTGSKYNAEKGGSSTPYKGSESSEDWGATYQNTQDFDDGQYTAGGAEYK